MSTYPKCASALIALVCLAVPPTVDEASAVSVEVAKKCRALTATAFPPRVAGNPAAGNAKGSTKDAQDYFKKCVANDGKVDDDANTPAK
jgi:hypothetical protein